MDIKNNISAKGIVNIKRIRDGVVQEDHTFHNLIIEKYFQHLYTSAAVVLGSGSTPPTQNDTGLEKQLAILNTSASSSRESDKVFKYSRSATWGTGTGTAGTICEVGLSWNYMLLTRALVTDSEGSPISIVKSEYDELKIIYDIHFTVSNQMVISKTAVLQPPLSSAEHLSLSRMYGVQNWSSQYNETTVNALDPSSSVASGTNVYSYTAEYTTAKSFGYANALRTYGAYYNDRYSYIIPFPNVDILPVRTLTGLSLGTGDGTTTDFTPDINWWLENTEKVYKNGTLLTRDVDYLVDNFPANRWALDFQYFFNGDDFNVFKALSLNMFVKRVYYVDNGEEYIGYCDKAGNTNYYSIYNSSSNTQGSLYSTFRDYVLEIDTNSAPNLTVDTVFFKQYYNCWLYYHGGNAIQNQAANTCDISFSNDNGNTWTTLPRPAKKTVGSFTGYNSIDAYNASTVGGRIDNYTAKLDTPITGVTHIKLSRYVYADVIFRSDVTIVPDITSETQAAFSAYNFVPYNMFIGHVGDYAIRFIDPPAAGDVLTMDCDIDRPWIGGKEVCKYTVTTTLTNA